MQQQEDEAFAWRVLGNKDFQSRSKPSKFQQKLEFVQEEQACAWPLLIAAGWKGSCLQLPPLGHSKIDSRKNASVFFQACCKPGNCIQQDLLQPRCRLLCAALREVFITLKSLPVCHRGFVQARRETELSGRKLETRWHVSSRPPQGAAGEETRTLLLRPCEGAGRVEGADAASPVLSQQQ